MRNERKEELKDEMKNRISLALKDPILQQGFEIICKENAELRKIAEFQQSSNMNTHLENRKLKEGLTVGSMWNKHLNSLNKELEEDRDRYRNMVFDKDEQLTKAKEIIKDLLSLCEGETDSKLVFTRAEQFLNGEGCPDCLCEDCTKDCGIKELGLVEVEK